MRKVELVKGRTYWGLGVKATKGEIIQVADEKAEELVATGRFRTVVDSKEEGTENGAITQKETKNEYTSDKDKAAQKEKSLDKMSKDELIAYADSLEIDVSACKNNTERAALIMEFLEMENDSDDGDAPNEDENGAVPNFEQGE